MRTHPLIIWNQSGAIQLFCVLFTPLCPPKGTIVSSFNSLKQGVEGRGLSKRAVMLVLGAPLKGHLSSLANVPCFYIDSVLEGQFPRERVPLFGGLDRVMSSKGR